jgi:hypothetical protein
MVLDQRRRGPAISAGDDAAGIRNASGEAAESLVWQFRATTGGTGFRGQRLTLGRSVGVAVAQPIWMGTVIGMSLPWATAG